MAYDRINNRPNQPQLAYVPTGESGYQNSGPPQYHGQNYFDNFMNGIYTELDTIDQASSQAASEIAQQKRSQTGLSPTQSPGGQKPLNVDNYYQDFLINPKTLDINPYVYDTTDPKWDEARRSQLEQQSQSEDKAKTAAIGWGAIGAGTGAGVASAATWVAGIFGPATPGIIGMIASNPVGWIVGATLAVGIGVGLWAHSNAKRNAQLEYIANDVAKDGYLGEPGPNQPAIAGLVDKNTGAIQPEALDRTAATLQSEGLMDEELQHSLQEAKRKANTAKTEQDLFVKGQKRKSFWKWAGIAAGTTLAVVALASGVGAVLAVPVLLSAAAGGAATGFIASNTGKVEQTARREYVANDIGNDGFIDGRTMSAMA